MYIFVLYYKEKKCDLEAVFGGKFFPLDFLLLWWIYKLLFSWINQNTFHCYSLIVKHILFIIIKSNKSIISLTALDPNVIYLLVLSPAVYKFFISEVWIGFIGGRSIFCFTLVYSNLRQNCIIHKKKCRPENMLHYRSHL